MNVSWDPLTPRVSFPGHRSPGPEKPWRFIDAEGTDPVAPPPTQVDLSIAHTDDYVRDFLEGGGLASSAGFAWSREYRDSAIACVRSLDHAISSALETGEDWVSPVSGFHHAVPSSGMDYCALSGQVIASVSVWRRTGAVGMYVDMDAHFGNSVEDTRRFCPDLNRAIPRGMNLNPSGTSSARYAKSLADGLKNAGEADYVVLCHGADSRMADPLGAGVLADPEWHELAGAVARAVKVPMVYCLFGGYTHDRDELTRVHVRGAREFLRQRRLR